MSKEKIYLTDKEVDEIVKALQFEGNNSLRDKLLNYKKRYIPKKGTLAKVAFVVATKYGSNDKDPLNYKTEINQVENVKDYNETMVECIRKRYYYHPLKVDIFGTRVEARLAGYKKHLKLFDNVTDKYKERAGWKFEDMIKKLKRQIHLIEDFPEKWI